MRRDTVFALFGVLVAGLLALAAVLGLWASIPREIRALLVLGAIGFFAVGLIKRAHRNWTSRQSRINAIAKKIVRGEYDKPYSVYLRAFRDSFYVVRDQDLGGTIRRLSGAGEVADPDELVLEVAQFLDGIFRNSWPVVGLGKEIKGLFAKHAPGFVRVKDREWQTVIQRILKPAQAIFLVPSHRKGTLWELTHIWENRALLSKTFFIMPNADADILLRIQTVLRFWRAKRERVDPAHALTTGKTTLQLLKKARGQAFFEIFLLNFAVFRCAGRRQRLARRWRRAVKAAQKIGIAFPSYNEKGCVFFIDAHGKPKVLAELSGVDQRKFETVVRERVTEALASRQERNEAVPA